MHIRVDEGMSIAYCVCVCVWVYVNIVVADGGGRVSLCVKV